MDSKLVQGSIAAVLAAAALAALIWAVKTFVETVFLVSAFVREIPDSGVHTAAGLLGVHLVALVIVSALAAGIYLLFKRLTATQGQESGE